MNKLEKNKKILKELYLYKDFLLCYKAFKALESKDNEKKSSNIIKL